MRIRSNLGVAGLLFLALTVVVCVLVLDLQDTEAQASVPSISLGSSVFGRIESGEESDFYRLYLTATTDVWVYATGDLDTAGGLYNRDGSLLLANNDSGIVGRAYNFHIRHRLPRGTYYIGVISADQVSTGDYGLHARAVTDPGSTRGTAKRLSMGIPAGGAIDTTGDSDFFRLGLTETTDVMLYVRTVYGQVIGGLPLNSAGHPVEKNQYILGDLFYVRDRFDPGTHYIRVSRFGIGTPRRVYYTIHAYKDLEYPAFLRDCEHMTRTNSPLTGDPLYGCQWYLSNRSGPDINVESVWAEGITGEGTNVAVVDDGMFYSHEDLRANVNRSLNYDYTGRGNISRVFEHHGTKVAGVIAARDNDIGLRGVAPRATLYGYNLLADYTDANTVDAMTRNHVATAVSNNSWGWKSSQGLTPAPQFWTLTLQQGVKQGYGGRGTFYAFAVGNNHIGGSNANLEGIINHHAVTPVCAVNERDERATSSEIGANLWVCAPSGSPDADIPDVVSTENYDRYVNGLSGTSYSTPIVSGVAALLRQANRNLTWRDIKLILAESARRNDPTDPGWLIGDKKYGAESESDRYHFNHQYGFGVVDAGAAVQLGKNWITLPKFKSASAESARLNIPVPDYDPDRPNRNTTVSHQVTLATDIDFVEYVEVNVGFNHSSFRDLSIQLVSPSGAVSTLAIPYDTYTPDDPDDTDFFPLQGSFRLGSARHLGENPNGTWTLRVTDEIERLDGTLGSWGLTVYGHSKAAVAPEPPATEPPTVQLSVTGTPQVRLRVPIPVTATFSTPVTGFDLADITTANGTVSGLTGEPNGAVYTFDVNPNAVGEVTVDIPAASASTPAGIGNTGAVTLNLGLPYDDNRNGTIERDEVMNALADYLFTGGLTREEVMDLLGLYLFGD